ncbi:MULTISPECIES: flagellar assembly protein FliW [Pontibacillus]|uniref:Flagellar assembly factor FliW n=1 Tax=Pontibacillus chungwhensis TaxID=265426 RepID=A0ABY8UVD0_9BACI|nr:MULTISPECIES: flagellar assembly protein FliW [Pontibacillus]MCD5325909.1 flagellar assembly protein FliW [Pontibacillus sp. HN14]WIF97620.1 flagellar assembly protein FliW [Pontibacillus chungwhensis]
MNINTKYFGEVEVKEEEVVIFPNGLPGFEEELEFVILPIDEGGIYHSMQSVHKEEVSLVIANPYLFFKNYEFELDDQTLDTLHIERPEDVAVFSVLTLREPFSDTTANLQAPIIVNKSNQKGKQLILTNTPYMTRHLIAEGGDTDAHTE